MTQGDEWPDLGGWMSRGTGPKGLAPKGVREGFGGFRWWRAAVGGERSGW